MPPEADNPIEAPLQIIPLFGVPEFSINVIEIALEDPPSDIVQPFVFTKKSLAACAFVPNCLVPAPKVLPAGIDGLAAQLIKVSE